jgi:cytidyltransferase-like protein
MKRAPKSIGLIVGKFAPLHKGHQFLIESALEQVDRLLILVYDCPETTNIPLQTRAEWIRRLYPRVKVIEGFGAPQEHGDNPAITQKNLKFVKRSLPCTVNYVFSSEWYGEILARELGAENVLVDQGRVQIPVSGSKIRKDPKKFKKFLEAEIFHDLLKEIDDSGLF